MVTMTTAQTGASGGVDPLATIEVGAAPTVVTGVEARLINHYKMQVGKSYHALKSLAVAQFEFVGVCRYNYAIPHPCF